MRKPRGLCLRGGVGKQGGKRVHLAPNALGKASARILLQLLAHVAQNQGCDGGACCAEREHQVEEQVVVHAAILQGLATFRTHQLPITCAYRGQKNVVTFGTVCLSCNSSVSIQSRYRCSTKNEAPEGLQSSEASVQSPP